MAEQLHITQCDDPTFLPFAKARIKAMRATGLKFLSQRFDVGGVRVDVRIEGEHSFASVSGTPGEYMILEEAGSAPVQPRFLAGIRAGRVRDSYTSPDTSAGYNSWRGKAGVVTYNSGRLLRHAVYRVEQQNGTEYSAAADMWVNGRKVTTPFTVVSAAIFSKPATSEARPINTPVAVTLVPGSPLDFFGRHINTGLKVYAHVDGEWEVIGEYTVEGTTLKSMQNLSGVGPSLFAVGYGSSEVDMPAAMETPIHFSWGGDKFLVLISPSSSFPASEMGPISGFASETYAVEGSITLNEGEYSVAFAARAVEPIDFSPAAGAQSNGSASGVVGYDYAKDGTELKVTVSYAFTFASSDGGVFGGRGGYGAVPAPYNGEGYIPPGQEANTLTYVSVGVLDAHGKLTFSVNGSPIYVADTYKAENRSTTVYTRSGGLVYYYVVNAYSETELVSITTTATYPTHVSSVTYDSHLSTFELGSFITYIDARENTVVVNEVVYRDTVSTVGEDSYSVPAWTSLSVTVVTSLGPSVTTSNSQPDTAHINTVVVTNPRVSHATSRMFVGGAEVITGGEFPLDNTVARSNVTPTVVPDFSGRSLGASRRRREVVALGGVIISGAYQTQRLWAISKGVPIDNPQAQLSSEHRTTALEAVYIAK